MKFMTIDGKCCWIEIGKTHIFVVGMRIKIDGFLVLALVGHDTPKSLSFFSTI